VRLFVFPSFKFVMLSSSGVVLTSLPLSFFTGFPYAFGVFQDYYSTHEPFSGSYNIALIGTCSTVNASPSFMRLCSS
jgi:hypothetical protein